MTQELQDFLILLCLLASYPIMPIMAWQHRDKFPTLAIIVMALSIFIVPVFVIGFSSLWAKASQIITAPFSVAFSPDPSSGSMFQKIRIVPGYAPRWEI
jgi:hypothetical protein